MTVYAVYPERIKKEHHARWTELNKLTPGLKNPEIITLPEQLAVSAIYYPIVTLAGYPIAMVRNFRATDWGIDLSVSITPETFLEPIVCGSPSFAHVWVKYLDLASKALGVPVKGDPSEFRPALYQSPDKWIKERIGSTRTRTEAPPIKETVYALAYQLSRSDWRRNLQTLIRDRVATVEYVNRMWVWVCQNVAKDDAFGELLDQLEAWMGRYALFLNQDRLRGAVSNMANDKPVERKIPVPVKSDSLPIPYGARATMFETLKMIFFSYVDTLEMPPSADDELWHKANTTEYKRRQPNAQIMPENVTDATKGFVPVRRSGSLTISLTNGTKLLTVANSQYSDALMERVLPVVEEYFSEVRDQINLAV